MLFESRRQSFKILSMLLFLVGSMSVANCRAERTPISLVSQSFCQQLIEADGQDHQAHLAAIKQERERSQRLWSEFKLFANEQAASVKQKWASLDLGNWRERLSDLTASPAAKRQPAGFAKAGSISVTTMAVNLRGEHDLVAMVASV